jgi:hypothetical protein
MAAATSPRRTAEGILATKLAKGFKVEAPDHEDLRGFDDERMIVGDVRVVS